jgi:hypothetical protein
MIPPNRHQGKSLQSANKPRGAPVHASRKRTARAKITHGRRHRATAKAIKSLVVVLDKAAMQDILLSLHAFDDEDSTGQDSQREKKYHRDDH